MVTYGDGPEGRGMNSYLNSSASPDSRCVSKDIAMKNGTDTDKMAEFEAANPLQQFPKTRLIPVWPIQQSEVTLFCTPPYDSRNVAIHAKWAGEAAPAGSPVPAGVPFSQDSYIAGYDYTFDVPEDCTWFHYGRGKTTGTAITYWASQGYDYDEGFYYWADNMPDGAEPRTATIIVNATKNTDIYNSLDNPCSTVCSRSTLFITQGASDSGYIAKYTGIDLLSINFTKGPDATNTNLNTAVILNETATSGSYFANGRVYGNELSSNYSSLVSVNGTSITANIKKIKEQFPDTTGIGGNITLDIYGTWEGVGPSSNKIPVPLRASSWSVDLKANNSPGTSISVKSSGNMNIAGPDLDSTSNAVDKLRARCAYIATIKYNRSDDSVTVEKAVGGGIRPVFYPTTLTKDGNAIDFEWMGSENSTNRDFRAIGVTAGQYMVNMTSLNGSSACDYEIYMAENTSGSSYTVNGNQLTSGQRMRISGNSFTINLSGDTGSTHRFYIQQIIDNAVVASGNASPEYAYIQFTIN